MNTVAQALREAARRLEGVSDTARLDAEVLMAEAFGVSRSDMLLRHMDDEVPDGFGALVDRRASSEPVAYIVGHQEFYGLDLAVTPDVLIPRADSETTVQAALDAAPSARRVLDCGTGSGALLLAFLHEKPEARGVGIDCSPAAVSVAAGNAERLGLSSRAEWFERNWREEGWSKDMGAFDLVIANPPYVEEDADLDASVRDFEPAGALFAGSEGLDDYRILMPQLSQLLAENGIAVLEIGAGQAAAVSETAVKCGFDSRLCRDLAGRPRALILERSR